MPIGLLQFGACVWGVSFADTSISEAMLIPCNCDKVYAVIRRCALVLRVSLLCFT
jgi:hypothetical protein